jgi:hypothetical protein
MAQSNPALLQGLVIDPINLFEDKDWPPLTVAVLTSGWGIEGVYSSATVLNLKILSLRDYGAYKGEQLAVKMIKLDSMSET